MREVIVLEPNWTAGEIPAPLIVQFLNPVQDLTGYSLQMRMERDGVEFTPGGSIDWYDATQSQAKITFADGDVEVTTGADYSTIEIEAWASGGGVRIATKTIMNTVYPQVGTAPTI